MQENSLEVVETAAVSVTEIRTLLAGAGHEPLTEAYVGQLVKRGLPKRARGQYDAVEVMTWYIGELRRMLRARGKIVDGEHA